MHITYNKTPQVGDLAKLLAILFFGARKLSAGFEVQTKSVTDGAKLLGTELVITLHSVNISKRRIENLFAELMANPLLGTVRHAGILEDRLEVRVLANEYLVNASVHALISAEDTFLEAVADGIEIMQDVDERAATPVAPLGQGSFNWFPTIQPRA